MLEVVVALAVLSVALIPVARILGEGIRRAAVFSRLRAMTATLGTLQLDDEEGIGPTWSRAGTTSRGMPCWARATDAATGGVAWTWVEVVCRPDPAVAEGGPGGRPQRLLLIRPPEAGP